MNKKNLLNLESVIESSDKYDGKKVSELIEKKGTIFQMIKKGYQFDDEVLEMAHIKRTVREHKVELVISEHEKDTKKYKKDTANIKDIIKEIDTLDYDTYVDDLDDDNDENIEYEV